MSIVEPYGGARRIPVTVHSTRIIVKIGSVPARTVVQRRRHTEEMLRHRKDRNSKRPIGADHLEFYMMMVTSICIASSLPYARALAAIAVPSWSDLTAQYVPSTPEPINTDWIKDGKDDGNARDTVPPTSVVRLYRERNGWCVYSARLWLALELKAVTTYGTILVEAVGDTYDGSVSSQNDRPGYLRDLSLPQLQFPNEASLHCGATEASSLHLLRELDKSLPGTTPLWPPMDSNGRPVCTANLVSTMCNEFAAAVPKGARESSRAAWLFCREEGYRLDPLPRSQFESFLEAAEKCLGQCSGPFFCGEVVSAADVVWAPLLERYAAQLPCLYSNLRARDSNQWPNLASWYKAMDHVSAYACRIKGDASSWRKVLYVDPWWPSADEWHSRDMVGPKGELLLSESECYKAFGVASFRQELWAEYASQRPFVEPDGPHAEAAALLVRNHCAVLKDAAKWIEHEEGHQLLPEDLDYALRAIAHLLGDAKLKKLVGTERRGLLNMNSVALLLAYLDRRVCVPRDMGAPTAAAIRRLATQSS